LISPNPKGWRGWRTVLLLSLFLSVPSVCLAKTKKSNDSDLSNMIRPDLVNAQTDPTLRFPVMRTEGAGFSATYGWLDISKSTIRYTVEEPNIKASQSFEVARLAIRDLRFNGSEISFKDPKKEQTIVYLPQDRWGSVHTHHGKDAAASRESLGTSSIYKTLLNFDDVLALVMPSAPAPAPIIAQPAVPATSPKPAVPTSPPAIVLSSPPGAEENQPLEWQQSTVVIRGVAMDTTGIPVVRINGSPANMRPQSTQAAEFWSDPLPLQAGNNRIQIVASNSAQVEAKLDLTIHYKPTRALDRKDILGLLQGGVPPRRVADLVKQRGIKFSPSADDLNAIRAAGGTAALIEAIQQAAPHP